MSDLNALSDSQILFIAKLTASADFKKRIATAQAVIPAGHHVVEAFGVEVGGAFDKAEDGDKAGTTKCLTLATVAIALQHAGVTREAALSAIEHGLNTVGSMSSTAQRGFLKDPANKGIADMHKRVTANFRTNAPRTPVKGAIKARGFVRPANLVEAVAVPVHETGEVNESEISEIDAALFIINAK